MRTTIHFKYTAKEAAFSGYWVYLVKLPGRATGSTCPEIGPTIHFRYTAKGGTFSADGVLSTNGAYQLGKETQVAVQLTGTAAAEWHPTSKLGDARHFILLAGRVEAQPLSPTPYLL